MSELLGESTAAVVPDAEARSRSALATALRNPLAAAALAFIVLLVLAAVFAPVLVPFPPNATRLPLTNTGPNGTYWLGGDASGRDIFSRLITASTVTVQAAATATSIAVLVGVGGGLVAGYRGGRWDTALSFCSNVLLTIPGLVALIALFAAIGPSIFVTMTLFGFHLAPSFFRLVRGLVLAVKNEPYIDAARVAGLTDRRIMTRHVLAVVRLPVLVQASFVAGTAVAIQAGLSFLGLGDPVVPSYGVMLQEAFRNIYAAPLEIVWPGIALGLTVSSFVLLGNAVRDSLAGQRRSQRRRRRARVVEAGAPAGSPVSGAVLQIDDLHVAFSGREGEPREVVHGVSLHVNKGEILGLVGQSGAGKSQTAFAVLGILPREAVLTGGSIRIAGVQMVGAPRATVVKTRRSVVGYVPQEPMTNLDPSYRVGTQLVYGLRAATGMSRRDARRTILRLFERVGIVDPDRTFDSYPHEISGGMAQRALIAGAVAAEPEVLIADEPTSSLDVTVQAEILDLLRELQRERGLGVLLVTHNLGVVADACDRVAVMNDGRIVEEGRAVDVLKAPKHPYTRRLIGAVLDEDHIRPPLVEAS